MKKPFALLLSAFALTICSCASLPRCPEDGGGVWRETRSPHFVVYSDLDSSQAREAALELEKLRAALLAAIGAKTDPPGTIEAVVLSGREAFKSFLGHYAGFFLREPEPLIVIAGEWVDVKAPFRIHAHELMHLLAAQLYVRLPRWINEGLASYFESIELGRDGQTAVVGWAAGARPHELASLSELWNWDVERRPPEEHERNLYRTSLLWMGYLQNEQRARLDEYLARLSSGEDPRTAWTVVFRDLTDEAWQQAVARYVLKAPRLRTVRFVANSPPLDERVMTAPDVHLLFARMWIHAELSRDDWARRVAHELQEAIRHDPRHLQARLLFARFGREAHDRLTKAWELTLLFPDCGTCWAEVWSASNLAGAPEEAALERALQNSERCDALALNNIAWALLEKGRVDEAMTLAERAAGLRPWSSYTVDTYAAALAAKGRCAEAVAMQERALALAPSDEPSDEYLERLLRYRNCASSEKLTIPEGAPTRSIQPLRDVVRARAPEIRACEVQSRQRNPELEGKLALRLRIERSGRVAAVEMDDVTTATDQGLIDCVRGCASSWRFPAAAEEVWFTALFEFQRPEKPTEKSKSAAH